LLAALAFVSGMAQARDNFEDARVAYEQGDFVAAHERLLAGAKMGDAESQELLAFMYALGPDVFPGVPQDLKMAAQLFDRASRSGRPGALAIHCALARKGAIERPARAYCFDRITD
jgi:TPR repeat protein